MSHAVGRRLGDEGPSEDWTLAKGRKGGKNIKTEKPK